MQTASALIYWNTRMVCAALASTIPGLAPPKRAAPATVTSDGGSKERMDWRQAISVGEKIHTPRHPPSVSPLKALVGNARRGPKAGFLTHSLARWLNC